MYCIHCGKPNADSSRFCIYCGGGLNPTAAPAPVQPESATPVNEPAQSQITPVQTVSTDTATVTSAAPVAAQPESTVSATTPEQAAPSFDFSKVGSFFAKLWDSVCGGCKKVTNGLVELFKSNSPKKWIIVGAGALALVLIILIIIFSSVCGGKTESPEFVTYIKDGELFYSGTAVNTTWQVSDRLIDLDPDDYDNEDIIDYASYGYNDIQVSADGKTIFYPEKINVSDDTFSLCYRPVNNPEGDSTKIASDVISYQINNAGNIVTYLSGDDNSLYRNDLKEKTLIARDVSKYSYYVSDNGKTIIYLTTDDNLYIVKGEDKERISSDVSHLLNISDDYSTVYYKNDSGVYKYVHGDSNTKILDEGVTDITVYSDGTMHYTISDITICASDFIDDDCADEDAAAAELEPEYPDWNLPYSTWSALLDKYYEDQEAKEEAQSRNEIRDSIKNGNYDLTVDSLYYYDGKTSKLIAKNVDDIVTYSYANKLIVYSVMDFTSSDKKIKLSDYVSLYSFEYDIETIMEDVLSDSAFDMIAKAGTAYDGEIENSIDYLISSNGSSIYFVVSENNGDSEASAFGIMSTSDASLDDDTDGNSSYSMYKITLSDDKLSEPELYDTDINAYGGSYYSWARAYMLNDNIVYFKNGNDDEADLYMNKKLVDYDVCTSNLHFIYSNNSVIYMTDWSNSGECGTLRIYRNGDSSKIRDDVYSCYTTGKGSIFYLCDYSLNSCTGDLYCYKNGKNVKIDTDVVKMIKAN